ncbi:MAG: methyltransferase [Rickettsiales bacterium]|nr:methyltransferase [Rickettsiales bacterium]
MKIISLLFLSFFIILIQSDAHCVDIKLLQAVENNNRKKENTIRDKYRNPERTLKFFGIQPEMNVVEILPGRGWYTEILSFYLKNDGNLTVASFGKDHPNKYLSKMHNNFKKYFEKKSQIFGSFNIVKFKKNNNYIPDIKSDSQDLVLTFRNSHNWLNNDNIDDIYNSINRVLKKNGILGVVQHRAEDFKNPYLSSKKGYIPESFLINLIEKKGFKLIEKSEINSNQLDTKNYPKGVWTLPPTLRLENKNKKKYLKIGESDRMTLKFKKVN